MQKAGGLFPHYCVNVSRGHDQPELGDAQGQSGGGKLVGTLEAASSGLSISLHVVGRSEVKRDALVPSL